MMDTGEIDDNVVVGQRRRPPLLIPKTGGNPTLSLVHSSPLLDRLSCGHSWCGFCAQLAHPSAQTFAPPFPRERQPGKFVKCRSSGEQPSRSAVQPRPDRRAAPRAKSRARDEFGRGDATADCAKVGRRRVGSRKASRGNRRREIAADPGMMIGNFRAWSIMDKPGDESRSARGHGARNNNCPRGEQRGYCELRARTRCPAGAPDPLPQILFANGLNGLADLQRVAVLDRALRVTKQASVRRREMHHPG
ncbi:MAG: hypothetical protein JWP15_2230 [Alphaproteobacteria bacterium]|nr:hypothetical protein [Alphaproteobacteria bacterium]